MISAIRGADSDVANCFNHLFQREPGRLKVLPPPFGFPIPAYYGCGGIGVGNNEIGG